MGSGHSRNKRGRANPRARQGSAPRPRAPGAEDDARASAQAKPAAHLILKPAPDANVHSANGQSAPAGPSNGTSNGTRTGAKSARTSPATSGPRSPKPGQPTSGTSDPRRRSASPVPVNRERAREDRVGEERPREDRPTRQGAASPFAVEPAEVIRGGEEDAAPNGAASGPPLARPSYAGSREPGWRALPPRGAGRGEAHREPTPMPAFSEEGDRDEPEEVEHAELVVPDRALRPLGPIVAPAGHAPFRPEVRGELGPLIDALHDLFARDRAIASQGANARCGICYLHFPLSELEYRETEGFYVCADCKQALGHATLPMIRRQQH